MSKPLFSNIVLAVTGSDSSILAEKYAVVMAKTYRCRLHAVYVVDTATIEQLVLNKIFIPEEAEEFGKNLEENGERYLSFVEELGRAKGVKLEKEIRRGAVCREILAFADEKQADVIILGGWEKDRNPREIFSETHREIVLNAKCSVLLIKEPNIDLIYRNA